MAKILIIGGGVAGLSAGIYAQLRGYDATICERHTKIGGNLTGWDREGYHIDNCIHWLTGTNPATKLYEMWSTLGVFKDTKIYQGNVLYSCKYENESLSLSKDLYKLRADMLRISPMDKDEINSLILAIEIMQGINKIRGINHNEGLSPYHMAIAIPLLTKYYSLTTKELSLRFVSPLLQSFITSFWGDNFGSLALIMVFAHFCGENGGIPRGGSCAMAKNMERRFSSLGGKILLSKEATKINHKDGHVYSVSFKDGDEIKCDYAIACCDPTLTFNKLLKLPMPKQLLKMYENKRLLRFSSYHCAFSCDMPSLPFEGDFIFKTPEKYKHLTPTGQVILREFSHEKNFSKEGCVVLQAMVFCYENDAKQFIYLKKNHALAYAKKKEEFKKALEEMIPSVFPQLTGKLRCIDTWTPATYHRYTSSDIGSYMSFALPSKMIPLRLSNKISSLDNFFLATQWQQIPGGLPIAAKSGKLAIDSLHKIEARKKSKEKAFAN